MRVTTVAGCTLGTASPPCMGAIPGAAQDARESRTQIVHSRAGNRDREGNLKSEAAGIEAWDFIFAVTPGRPTVGEWSS